MRVFVRLRVCPLIGNCVFLDSLVFVRFLTGYRRNPQNEAILMSSSGTTLPRFHFKQKT